MRLPEIWDQYSVHDEDGFVCGISDDAPEETKEAYKRHLEKIQWYIDNHKRIPK